MEIEKCERLLPEIEQAPKQEKEMADIEENLAASQVGDLLEAVREKLPASSSSPVRLTDQ